ncbi:MAG: sulfite oxidase [Hyphomicrobiales bacterium]
MNPFADTSSRPHREADFSREEVGLANRNHGFALEALRYDVTPIGMHYLLTHFDIPDMSAEGFSLEIGGAIENTVSISLDEIKALPSITQTVTLECAGNGRAHITPRHPSMPWSNEAVGTASWTGTSLKNVLQQVGLKPETVEIAFFGADAGFDKGHEHFYGRSLSPEHAMSDEVMLVYAMNGAPLLPQHGAPLRMIVPGWYGMASVKWLIRVEALTAKFDGYQQVDGYHYRENADDPGAPVRELRVKSLMIPPGIPDWYTRRRMVDAGSVALQGRAWSGNGVEVAKIEVGVDGTWHEATLRPRQETYAWTGWDFTWMAEPGEHVLACRATDVNGQTQPVDTRWDNSGLGNNGAQHVHVTVR